MIMRLCPIMFKFKVAILKIMYNMASLNISLTLKVTSRMDRPPPFSLTLTPINNESAR